MKKIISCLVAVMLVVFAAFPVFAAEEEVKSPIGTYDYKVVVEVSPIGSGTADYTITNGINDKGEMFVTLTATNKEGYKFDHWVIDGDYTTSNKLTDAKIDIVNKSDIHAVAYFVPVNSDATQAPTTEVNKDTSSSSPQTGSSDTALYFIILLAVAACGVTTFKFVKSK